MIIIYNKMFVKNPHLKFFTIYGNNPRNTNIELNLVSFNSF
jgi:hypothetical protein